MTCARGAERYKESYSTRIRTNIMLLIQFYIVRNVNSQSVPVKSFNWCQSTFSMSPTVL